MATPDTINEVTQLQIEYSLKAAQMNLARAEEQLALKKYVGMNACCSVA
jgi:hypothetical protein